MRGVVEGGPADGARVALVAAATRWIDAEREMGFSRFAPGRALYRRVGDRWQFTGHKAVQCGGCGVLVIADTPGRCPLCGRELGGGTHGADAAEQTGSQAAGAE